MTLKHMKIFVTVYREMNMTKAAETLHMTQPAVTRSIQELEKYYGASLFERMNHRLYRTAQGEELYACALQIVDSFAELEKGIHSREDTGILRIGGSITNGAVVLPAVLPAFQKEHPHLRLQVTVSNSTWLQQALLDNRIDLALIEGKVTAEQLKTEALGQTRLALLLPAGHPLCKADSIRLQELAAWPLLLREKGSANRAFIDHIFGSRGLEARPLWESVSTQALIRAVAAGLGISILPEQLACEALAAGDVCTRPVEDEAFVRQNYMVWHRQKRLGKSAEELVDLCRQKCYDDSMDDSIPEARSPGKCGNRM